MPTSPGGSSRWSSSSTCTLPRIGRPTDPGCASQVAESIAQQLDTLRSLLADVREVGDHLEQRITPVLRQPEPTPALGTVDELNDASAVSRALLDIERDLRNVRAHLAGLVTRVEL